MTVLSERLVQMHARLDDRDAVLERLAHLFVDEGRAADADALLADLQAREREVGTAMGLGFAMPHAKSAAVSAASVAYLRLAEPIDWAGETVHTVFGIAVPDGEADEHLRIIAGLARRMIDEEFRGQLDAAATADQVVTLLEADGSATDE